MPGLNPEIISAILQIIGAGVIGLIGLVVGRYWQSIDRNRKKYLEWGYTPTNIVNPSRIGPLSVSVDREYISGQASDRGVTEQVSVAYNFVVGVSNIGIDDVASPEIDIALDDNAVIVGKPQVTAGISDDKVQVSKDPKQPNFVRVVPEYINRNESITLSILSIHNTSDKCNVRINGIGIKFRRRASSAETGQTTGFSYFIFMVILLIIAMTSAIYALALDLIK